MAQLSCFLELAKPRTLVMVLLTTGAVAIGMSLMVAALHFASRAGVLQARQLLLASVIYLPALSLLFVLDAV